MIDIIEIQVFCSKCGTLLQAEMRQNNIYTGPCAVCVNAPTKLYERMKMLVETVEGEKK